MSHVWGSQGIDGEGPQDTPSKQDGRLKAGAWEEGSGAITELIPAARFRDHNVQTPTHGPATARLGVLQSPLPTEKEAAVTYLVWGRGPRWPLHGH